MTTITVAYDVSEEKFDAIRELAEHEQKYNAGFNGDALNVERGDFTCIKNNDDLDAVILLNKVQSIIVR